MNRILYLGLTALCVFSILMSTASIPALADYTGNHCLNFDGKDDYASCGYAKLFELDFFTIETWIKAKYTVRMGSDSAYGHSFGTLVTRGSMDSYELGFDYGQGYLRFGFKQSDWPYYKYSYHTNKAVWYNTTWYHIAVTYNRTLLSGNLVFYVNGAFDSQHDNTVHIAAIDRPLLLGSLQGGNAFGGLMDEVRIWNVSRSGSEIQSTMYRILDDTERKNPNLIGYWRFDEGTGEFSQDLSQYDNDAALAYSPANPEWFKPTDSPIGPPPPLSTKIFFNISPNPTAAGETITLEGVLFAQGPKPISYQKVTIYARPLSGSWIQITSLTTSSQGLFIWQATIPPVTGTYIFAVYFAGSELYKSTYSFAVLVIQ